MSYNASERTVAAVFNILRGGGKVSAVEIASRIGKCPETVKAAIHVLRNSLAGDPLIEKVVERRHLYYFTNSFGDINEWEGRQLRQSMTRGRTCLAVDSSAGALGYQSARQAVSMPRPLAIERAENS